MSEYDVLINKYDALKNNYDQLYPQPMKHASTHASGGTDPITPSDIGVYSKNEIDTLLSNKAPAGFGYGDTLQLIGNSNITEDDFVSALESVYSKIPNNTVKQVRISDHPTLDGGIHFGQLWRSDANYGALIVYSYFDFKTAPIIRIKTSGVWKPWEYVNPPMNIGIEYRTTERYQGKPVYAQCVKYPGVTPSGYGEYAHGIANISSVIRASGELRNKDADKGMYMPVFQKGGGVSTSSHVAYFTEVSHTHIAIYTGGSYVGKELYVTMYYTKTTD